MGKRKLMGIRSHSHLRMAIDCCWAIVRATYWRRVTGRTKGRQMEIQTTRERCSNSDSGWERLMRTDSDWRLG